MKEECERMKVTEKLDSEEMERRREACSRAAEAGARHWAKVKPIAPGFSAVTLDTDLHMRLPIWRDGRELFALVTLHQGLFHIKEQDGKGVIYVLRTSEAGEPASGGQGTHTAELEVKLVPARTKYRAEPVTIEEALVQSYAQDLINAGREEEADEVIRDSYLRTYLKAEQGVIEDGALVGEGLPRQDSYPVPSVFKTLSKVSDSFTKIGNGEAVAIDVSGKNERDVLTTVSLDYANGGVKLGRPVSEFDIAVNDTIAGMYKYKNQVITARQVAVVLTQKEKPSPQLVSKVGKSMDRQRFTSVRINYDAELRGKEHFFEGEKVVTGYYETYMLKADKSEIETQAGTIETGYIINEWPILYRHDATFGQVATVKSRYIKAAAETARSTTENIVVRGYLVRRIERGGKGKQNGSIRYETIAERAGVDIAGKDAASRKRRKALADTVNGYLDAWRREGYVKAWHEYAEDGEVLTEWRRDAKTGEYETKRRKGCERKRAAGVCVQKE